MITIRLMGGLGNQLFQVSAMLFVRSELGRRARCELSWYAYDNKTPRDYEVGSLLERGERYRIPAPFARAVYSRKNPRARFEGGPGDPVLDRVPRGWAWVVGYHQRAQYALATRDDLARRLRATIADRQARSSPVPAIGVHVRLGDYVTNPHARAVMGLTDLAYYVDAVAALRADLGCLPVRLFTDSPDLFRALYRDPFPAPIEWSSAWEPWEVLVELSSCAGIVMANSSLSWWSAFVATVLEGRDVPVVMPRPWFAEISAADQLLRVPGWSQVDRGRSVG